MGVMAWFQQLTVERIMEVAEVRAFSIRQNADLGPCRKSYNRHKGGLVRGTCDEVIMAK